MFGYVSCLGLIRLNEGERRIYSWNNSGSLIKTLKQTTGAQMREAEMARDIICDGVHHDMWGELRTALK